MISLILKLFFYQSPILTYSSDEIAVYDKIFDDAIRSGGVIHYTSTYPKHRFIAYIAAHKGVLLHGSNDQFIEKFETRRQTLFNGEYVEAVFATKDGIWPLFYAVFDKKKLIGNIRNGCLETRSGARFHFYSFSQESGNNTPWTRGMIYFLPMDSFKRAHKGLVSFDEWTSQVPVKPIAKINVEVEDFYYHDKVSVHKSTESVLITWLKYKLRILFRKTPDDFAM
ncbi:hypothetical protein E0485_05195 [Paenibacillus albiflavus]|uniref:Uncharacterized protein n=1 Tax=Paenibacillus albiflavus TaxID=2545760 RepID=A0A4R4EGQ7_9BACL|nr:hypothetical protein [Paenibacillus albiflavus]TCZ79266.1 hypothetical protein E0485_05195 [Paenibacillus albiflavus]